eukprot:357811-Chlamydomonas_euryale.AAC.1
MAQTCMRMQQPCRRRQPMVVHDHAAGAASLGKLHHHRCRQALVCVAARLCVITLPHEPV